MSAYFPGQPFRFAGMTFVVQSLARAGDGEGAENTDAEIMAFHDTFVVGLVARVGGEFRLDGG